MDQVNDFKREKKKRKKAVTALVAAAIIIVGGILLRAKLMDKFAEDDFDYYDNPHDTELGAVM
ncbi:MAG: hypothetical protein ABIR81_00810 [Ginsengibacter sp.]